MQLNHTSFVTTTTATSTKRVHASTPLTHGHQEQQEEKSAVAQRKKERAADGSISTSRPAVIRSADPDRPQVPDGHASSP